MAELLYKQESYIIQGVVFDIYKKFRNRHKEKVYQNSFYLGLKNKGLNVEKEKRIDVLYNNKKVGTYTPDLVVNNAIFIELKVKPKLTQEDIKQFWYYLRASGYRLGYFINFGASNSVQIIRKIYGYSQKKTR
jgi:GxxExxY protein